MAANTAVYIIKLMIAIMLTAAAYFLGGVVNGNKILLWQALVIGASVVLAGAFVERINAPMGLIIATPFPIGMILLYIFLDDTVLSWLGTYAAILLIYTVIHVVASALFRFHSLIPAWKLRGDQ